MIISPLVVYTKVSPNKSARKAKIDTITIHHMACNPTIETQGDNFAVSSRQASSNYGIGSDGRIACYAPEEYRSWCSNSRANDDRAITNRRYFKPVHIFLYFIFIVQSIIYYQP